MRKHWLCLSMFFSFMTKWAVSTGTFGPFKDPAWDSLHFPHTHVVQSGKDRGAQLPSVYTSVTCNSYFSLRGECGRLRLSFLPGEWFSNLPLSAKHWAHFCLLDYRGDLERGCYFWCFFTAQSTQVRPLIGSVGSKFISKDISHPSNVIQANQLKSPLTKYPDLGFSEFGTLSSKPLYLIMPQICSGKSGLLCGWRRRASWDWGKAMRTGNAAVMWKLRRMTSENEANT